MEPTRAQMEQGRLLFSKPCEFRVGAVSLADIPAMDWPELAFAGRSNVGKSSLINALTGRNTLARTSQTPGCTRQLNFFLLDERYMLVDMPGYGYAKVSKLEKKRWDALILDYFRGRANLRRVFILVDARHGFKPVDREHMELLDETAVSYQIVFTKSDKLTEAERNTRHKEFEMAQKKHPALHPEYFMTSSRAHEGIELLRAEIAQFSPKS